MGHKIEDFIGGFKGGTRVNRFVVTGQIGPLRGGAKTPFTQFHVRSANLPEAILGSISVNWRGRTVSYPGDRTYKPWEISILDDVGPRTLFKAFHDWHNAMNNHESNTSPNAGSPKSNFASDWTIQQYDPNGTKIIKQFTLNNCWPVGIGQFQLDMAQDNKLGAFSVGIVYSHYVVNKIA
jgi:hypothetical protein